MICNFCGMDQLDVVEGVSGCICRSCIHALEDDYERDVADALGLDFTPTKKEEALDDVQASSLKPHELKRQLDAFVIGQESAKKTLAVEVCNHYKRVARKEAVTVDIPKANILISGPSGSGKTYLLEQLAKILSVPFVVCDATSLTEAGYVGRDVESLAEDLLMAANNDIELAQRGIIYIDEIDKLATGATKSIRSREVGGIGVQQALLKLLEGVTLYIGDKREAFSTKDVLFVCGGAFEGIDKIIQKRAVKTYQFGFQSCPTINQEQETSPTVEDYVQYGLIREFIGRMHLLVELEALTQAELADVLTKPNNAIVKQYQALFELDGITLTFEDEAIAYVAESAHKAGTGARAIKGVLSKQLQQLMYELPQQDAITEYTITRVFLENPTLKIAESSESFQA